VPEEVLAECRWREYNIEPVGFFRMIVLALDTTTRAGSAALLRNGDVLAGLSGDPALTHGQRLPGELVRLLDDARIPLAEISLLAVAAGPGSFTGLRVGIATIQGLAVATGTPVVPVSTLEALARAAADRGVGGLIVPWMDAQRGEVYSAVYDSTGKHVLLEPSALPPAQTLERIEAFTASRPLHFLGDGAVRYAAAIEEALGQRARIDPGVPRLAVPIARIALDDPARALSPHAIAPVYVRRPDAELARDRRARGA
jgi:tRNA threonylcarbamoyladenosine biosynthesis protein TsaB